MEQQMQFHPKYINGMEAEKKISGFIDFRKAFNLVDYELLWKKLWRLGVSTKVLTILQNMCTVCCLYKYGCSEKIDCSVGVGQGCPLSPTLFSLFVSDVMECMREKTDGYHLIKA